MIRIIPMMVGTTELLLIVGIALLLFGGKKLPEMMRGLGKGVREFKEGMKDTPQPEERAFKEKSSKDVENDVEENSDRS